MNKGGAASFLLRPGSADKKIPSGPGREGIDFIAAHAVR